MIRVLLRRGVNKIWGVVVWEGKVLGFVIVGLIMWGIV